MFEALNDAPRIDRERGDRSASLSACIIDSQNVKTNEVRGPRGYDAENMIIGRKLSVSGTPIAPSSMGSERSV